MCLGGLYFFYCFSSKARCIVGVVSVVREWYEDSGGAVDVRAVGEMKRSVDLKELKGDDGLKGFGRREREESWSQIFLDTESILELSSSHGFISDSADEDEDEDVGVFDRRSSGAEVQMGP
ncbi:hypothetical protein LOK49_LG01G00204 [Camellia lanceoleosa]|uniref:Uncharacterized protein n=1 Tax=Camellia lanceoleosa TaxID=1840588 RepID=A0ACC0J6I2_9ERIC|nr:hypothetical protein LOK49_LG01G00204 [Camellia lanceoleosa]